MASGETLDADVSGILVGDAEAEAQALCPEYLSTVIAPCLNAICALQGALDELAGRPPADVRVLAMIQDWPISISLAEATEALLVIQDMILPKAGRLAHEGDGQAVDLGITIVSRFGPNLLESQRIGLVSRLLPSLETLLSTPLQVSLVRVSSD